ncbi:MAG: insulinase family protein, partial [Nitrosospira sp.]|nr:insulinase family protein [Nitrosospira sp.]
MFKIKRNLSPTMKSLLPAIAALLLLACVDTQPGKNAQATDHAMKNEPAGEEAIHVVDYDVTALEYPELGDFQIPDPHRIVLDNGLTVFLLEDHSLPQISAIARIGTGSVWEPAKLTGLAGITGNVMRTGGTAILSPREVNQALANVGATVETGIGATSGFAYMNTLTGALDTALPIFQAILTQPAFAQEKVKLAKSRAKSAISRRNDSPQGIAFREMGQLIFGADSPYARVPQYYT